MRLIMLPVDRVFVRPVENISLWSTLESLKCWKSFWDTKVDGGPKKSHHPAPLILSEILQF